MSAGPRGLSTAWNADRRWGACMLPGPTKLWGLRKAFWPLKYIPYVVLEVLDFSLLEISLLLLPRTPGLAQFRWWGRFRWGNHPWASRSSSCCGASLLRAGGPGSNRPTGHPETCAPVQLTGQVSATLLRWTTSRPLCAPFMFQTHVLPPAQGLALAG